MICHRCLYRASALRIGSSQSPNYLTRAVASSASPSPPQTASTHSPSDSTSPTFTTPLPLSHPKARTALPISSCPAGSSLKGLNFLKGREDPIALPDEDYPEWLWHCFDAKTKDGKDGEEIAGDEFSKSKKQRRLVAKQRRKLEARLHAAGDTEALAPKIPLQQQTIDLPSNEEGSLNGALKAVEKREEVRKAMRTERRAKIKESNFLKGM